MTTRFKTTEPKKTLNTKTGEVHEARNKVRQTVAFAEFPELDAATLLCGIRHRRDVLQINSYK